MKKTMLLTACVLAGSLLHAGDRPLRVAVFPFESETKDDSSAFKQFLNQAAKKVRGEENRTIPLGEKIAELLTAELAQNPGIELVERAKINKTIDELALGKTGLVDDASAARVGHMMGAHVLVTGKAFPLDDEIFIVAKVIGVETSRVFAAKSNGPLSGKLTPIVNTLGKDVHKILLKKDDALVASPKKEVDHVALITKGLGQTQRPRVAVFVKEKHVKQDAVNSTVETELIFLLQKTGFTVVDEKNRPLADWAKSYLEGNNADRRPGIEADVIIVGEAFSEFAARRGDLLSCKARVELRALSAKTGDVLAIDRKTSTGVDIAEQIAARIALQTATQDISVTLIPALTHKWTGK